ncbi:hypothetical protein ACJJTC_012591 [Scirpophaga incertulas]
MGRGRGLRHGGRAGRAGRARYSCRGAQGRAALSERLSRPTIAARLPPAPRPRRARVPRPPHAAAAAPAPDLVPNGRRNKITSCDACAVPPTVEKALVYNIKWRSGPRPA